MLVVYWCGMITQNSHPRGLLQGRFFVAVVVCLLEYTSTYSQHSIHSIDTCLLACEMCVSKIPTINRKFYKIIDMRSSCVSHNIIFYKNLNLVQIHYLGSSCHHHIFFVLWHLSSLPSERHRGPSHNYSFCISAFLQHDYHNLEETKRGAQCRERNDNANHVACVSVVVRRRGGGG